MNVIVVALDAIKIKISIGLQAARDANQVDLIPAGETFDVLTVHRVHIKNQKKMGVILVILVNILIQKPRRVQVAQVVDIIPAGEILDVLTVHRVHIKNQVTILTVIIVGMGNINQKQLKDLQLRVLTAKMGNVLAIIITTHIQLQRLVIFVLKARHLWPKMKNVEDVQQEHTNHRMMFSLLPVKIVL